MAIYTKTGDRGTTKVFDRKTKELVKISKSSCKIAAIGTIDELNSFLGIIGDLTEVQGNLFTINSILAGSPLRFSKSPTKKLEKEIDKLEGTLPVLKNFIYYGGGAKASNLFYARALCRLAERSLVTFSKKYFVKQEIMTYMNRLSDLFFTMARFVNFKEKQKEVIWRGK